MIHFISGLAGLFFTNFDCFVQQTQSLERITPKEKTNQQTTKPLTAVLWLLPASPELDELQEELVLPAVPCLVAQTHFFFHLVFTSFIDLLV